MTADIQGADQQRRTISVSISFLYNSDFQISSKSLKKIKTLNFIIKFLKLKFLRIKKLGSSVYTNKNTEMQIFTT